MVSEASASGQLVLLLWACGKGGTSEQKGVEEGRCLPHGSQEVEGMPHWRASFFFHVSSIRALHRLGGVLLILGAGLFHFAFANVIISGDIVTDASRSMPY